MNLHVIVARVNSVQMCIASYKASYVSAIANMKIVLQPATGVVIKLYSWLASEDFILSCDACSYS